MTAGDEHWQTLVEVTRGDMVESRHRGAAAVSDAAGNIVASWGNIGQPVYPRSAIKPLQALPIVESGAAEAYGVSPEELALACGSHTGEAMHTDRVAAWLDRISCTVDDLLCGSQWPMDEKTRRGMIAAGQKPSALHNNCSGKHAGMLATAKHLNEPLDGYVDITHPVQQRIVAVLQEMTGEDLSGAPVGIDGCAIPTVAVSLKGLALAMARMGAPGDLSSLRGDACKRMTAAWGGHPQLISGTGRFDSVVTSALEGRGMVKGGAEGVACAALPSLGLGVSLKISDGAGRAADVALAGILHKLGALSADEVTALSAWTRPILKNRSGIPVGEIRPVETL